MQFGRAVGQPAAESISGGQRNEGNRNLRRPDEVRGAKEWGKHFGAEDFDDEYDCAGRGGREVKVSAEASPRLCCGLALFHGFFLRSFGEKIKTRGTPSSLLSFITACAVVQLPAKKSITISPSDASDLLV